MASQMNHMNHINATKYSRIAFFAFWNNEGEWKKSKLTSCMFEHIIQPRIVDLVQVLPMKRVSIKECKFT